MKAVWDGLTAAEREQVRAVVLATQPAGLAKFPALVERFCLEELARRKGTTPGT